MPAIWWSPAIQWSIRSMDFDNRKVYGDTSITDGLVIIVIFIIYYYISLYIQHCKRSSEYLPLILYSASHFGDINTKLIKRTFLNLSPEKKWRRQRRRPSNTDSNKRSNRRTTKADNKGSRQDLLGNIYPIYPTYIQTPLYDVVGLPFFF